MTNLTISVVIPTCNRKEEIVFLLHSLKKQIISPKEIIIVDSSDDRLSSHKEFNNFFSEIFFPNTKLNYIYSEKKGAALQRNIGAKSAAGDLIFFIDDDRDLRPDYIQKMYEIFKKDPNFAGGMCQIDGCGQKKINFNILLRKFFLLQREGESGKFTFSGMPVHPYSSNKFTPVNVLDGTAVYKREVFLKYCFDENLGKYSYMEDCDLSWRISQDYKLFFYPETMMFHNISKKNRLNIVENRAVYIRNYSYLFFKNFYSKNKLRIFGYLWSVTGLFIEAILARNRNYLKGYCLGLRSFYFGSQSKEIRNF